MNKMLYLVRGIPGAGKSTFVKEFSAGKYPYFEEDQYFRETGKEMRNNTVDKIFHNAEAVEWCIFKTKDAMEKGPSKIFVANPFVSISSLKPYRELAATYNYSVTSLVVENFHQSREIAPKTKEKLQEAASKFEYKLL